MNFLANLASSVLDDQENFTDLTQVAVVNENACLDVLQRRFDNRSIYTHCGPLLVAVNPYELMDELYAEEVLEQHLQLLASEAQEPHVYGMAARAYQQMMATGQHQAVVISGESGAGKTETAKFLLTYLARAAVGHATDANSEHGVSLHTRVMGTNPIMESFGCAQTVRNDNSSRFGKLVLLQFTKTGRLSAASVQTYLLEKSRVVHQADNEANYHCFYEALAGMTDQEWRDCSLVQPLELTDLVYLETEGSKRRPVAKDGELYARTRDAMLAIGLPESDQMGVLRLLLAITYLGNLDFGSADAATMDADAEPLVGAARLLGCDASHLAAGMCTRKLKAGTDWVTTANTVEQASEVRHALAKQLYSFLFTWLVVQINLSLAYNPDAAVASAYGLGAHIAYVDIFGFEIFATNSLEQLCINFANERLQRLFVGVLFESVHQMYEAEGIDVEATEYSDNKRVVDLIGGAPQGLLAMLTEECVFPKGNDTTYLGKVVAAFKRHEQFREVKTSSTEFAVKHYAGEVVYTVTGFLEKNKDPISQDLQVLIQFSDDEFVVRVVKAAVDKAAKDAIEVASAVESMAGAAKKGSRMRSGKFVGVVDGFKASLKSLIMTVQAGKLHFIRCLKPNDDKASLTWDRSVSARQLASTGLVHAVDATRSGYTDHLSPTHIVSVFGALASDVPTTTAGGEPVGDMATARAVLESLGVIDDQYAIGRTKVFLKQGVLSELQRLRLEYISDFATMVQASIRRLLAHRKLRKLREAAARKEEERRAREEERRRQLAEAERRRLERERREEEERLRAELEEAERRKQVQKARSLSFDRRRRKKAEEEERMAREAREEAERARRARQEAAAAKRIEAEDRMRSQLQAEGVSFSPSAFVERDVGSTIDDDDDEADLKRRTEAAVARAEAEAAAVLASNRTELQLPRTSADSAQWGGGAHPPSAGGTGFKLQLPSSGSKASSAEYTAPVGRLLEQRKMDDLASQFACPLEDVLAYAEMVGMDVHEDAELLWIADEALQAPEPVGWDERQDPRGNTYYMNSQTMVTMMQHPVDYHYQQLYLQYKKQKAKQEAAAAMTPRSRARFENENEQEATLAQSGSMKLDLRNVSSDRDDSGDDGKATPRGWLKRTLTPRATRRIEEATTRNELVATLDAYSCVEVEVAISRGKERLGMELNAYNQILSFQPNGPTDRHPEVHLYDRIVIVDGINLGARMLTDVLVPKDTQQFVLERWAPTHENTKGTIPQQLLLHLGKSRANGASIQASISSAIEEAVPQLAKKSKRRASGSSSAADGPYASRFTISIQRGETGLGLVLDEDNVVVDMVPGSPVELQRHKESKGDPRLQLGDKIMTVDGKEVNAGSPLASVIEPADWHALSVERMLERKPESKPSPTLSPRGVLKMMTPRSSVKADKDKSKASNSPSKPRERMLREVRIYKAHEDERLGIRFVRDDEGFDRHMWGDGSVVTPIVAALDPKGEAARSGMEIDDMVLSINGQTGLSNTEAAAMLRDLQGSITLVVRKCTWLGIGVGEEEQEVSSPTPMTPRSATRKLV